MKIRTLYFNCKASLDDERTEEDLIWLLTDFYNFEDESKLFLHFDDEVDESKFLLMWNELKNTPIQHLLGYGYFLGKRFIVSKDVLIPRNETEELVIYVSNYLKENKKNKVLDIGVGSGAILLSLEMMSSSDFEGIGVDISSSALEICKQNKAKYNLNSKLLLSDVYENVPKEKFDVIVSNPPYIDEGEFVGNRVDKEPRIALYAKNKGMEVYEKMLQNAKEYLNKNGLIALEISPSRKEDILRLVKLYFEDAAVDVVRDINNFERFIYIKCK